MSFQQCITILLIHEHMNMGCFPIYLDLLQFLLTNILYFADYKLLTFLVKCISKYFMHLWCYCKWDCLLNFIFKLSVILNPYSLYTYLSLCLIFPILGHKYLKDSLCLIYLCIPQNVQQRTLHIYSGFS